MIISNIIVRVAKIPFNILKTLTILVLFVISLIMFSVLRLFVGLGAKILRRDLLGFVTGYETVCTLGKPLNLLIILIYEGTLTENEVREDFQERILYGSKAESYKRLILTWENFWGYPFWKKEIDFDLKKHIRKYDYSGYLSSPPNPTKMDLERIAENLVDFQWKDGESPWEILIVENIEGLSKTAGIIRFNHILGDGYSMIGLLRDFFGSPLTIPRFKLMETSPSKFGKFLFILKSPFDLFLDTIRNGQMKLLPTGEKKFDGFRLVNSPKVSVETIKSIKNFHGINYNAVVYSAIVGAIARGIKEAGLEIPEFVTASIVLPDPSHPGGFCNKSYFTFVTWQLSATTPEERLLSVQKTLERISKSSAPFLTRKFGEIFTIFPTGWKHGLWWSLTENSFAHVGIPTLPVISSTDYYRGYRVSDIIASLSTLRETSLSIAAFGIENQQQVSFCMDKGSEFPPEMFTNLGKYFLEEIQVLAEGVNV